MDRLVAGNCAPSSPEGAKMLTPADPAFDGPVILLQDVVKVLHRSMSAVLLQCTFDFELRNHRRITGVLVGVDGPRRRLNVDQYEWKRRRCNLCDGSVEIDLSHEIELEAD